MPSSATARPCWRELESSDPPGTAVASPDLSHFDGDLQKLRGAAKHRLALINDILDLSQIETAR
jgi:hypothetical protein